MFQNGPSDQWLVHQILEGSQEAANTLFYRYYDAIFRFLVFNHISNQEDARDVTQDTFRKAWESIGNLRNTERFDAWLYRIARNLATDYFRRKKPQCSLEELPFEEDKNFQGEDAVLAYMQFEQVLQEMPEQQRRCLQLLADGLVPEEIARALHLGLGTVQAYISQGRKKLRTAFFGPPSKKLIPQAKDTSVLQSAALQLIEGNTLSEKMF